MNLKQWHRPFFSYIPPPATAHTHQLNKRYRAFQDLPSRTTNPTEAPPFASSNICCCAFFLLVVLFHPFQAREPLSWTTMRDIFSALFGEPAWDCGRWFGRRRSEAVVGVPFLSVGAAGPVRERANSIAPGRFAPTQPNGGDARTISHPRAEASRRNEGAVLMFWLLWGTLLPQLPIGLAVEQRTPLRTAVYSLTPKPKSHRISPPSKSGHEREGEKWVATIGKKWKTRVCAREHSMPNIGLPVLLATQHDTMFRILHRTRSDVNVLTFASARVRIRGLELVERVRRPEMWTSDIWKTIATWGCLS